MLSPSRRNTLRPKLAPVGGAAEVLIEVVPAEETQGRSQPMRSRYASIFSSGAIETQGERGVAGLQVSDVAEVVHEHRAAGATRVRPAVGARAEHEVVDDQLPAALEQVQQADVPVRPLEHVVLVDPHHRQPAALGGECVVRPHRCLLLGQQLLVGGLPLGL